MKFAIVEVMFGTRITGWKGEPKGAFCTVDKAHCDKYPPHGCKGLVKPLIEVGSIKQASSLMDSNAKLQKLAEIAKVTAPPLPVTCINFQGPTALRQWDGHRWIDKPDDVH